MPAAPVLPSPGFPKAQLLKIVQAVSGVQCVWTTARRGLQGLRPGTESAWLIAGVQSYMAIGVDELRQVFDPVHDGNASVLVGQRQFTLELRAQSLDSSLEAFDLLERVRFRFRTQTARALMVPTLALRDFGPIVALPDATYEVGGTQRSLLEATLDVRMACVVSASLTDLGAGDYIVTAPVPPGVAGGSLLP